MILQRLNINTLEQKDAPLPHHLAGLQYTRTGYGKKIPTTRMVKIPGMGNRWRRVYCCIFSNSGTCYVDTKKGWIVVY